MAEFIIRPAAQEDFPTIRSLIHTVKINPTGLDWRRFLVVVTPLGELLGCGQIKPHGDQLREMASIAVLEHVRGQGVARAVIEALLALELERPIYLMCRARLKELYAKFGFQNIGMDKMPLYFRRISRVEQIFNSKAKLDNRLMVMRLD